MPIRKTPEGCGVYVIRTPSGKCYVGSTISFRQRGYVHRSELRKRIHHCRSLQEEYDEHGEAALSFELIEICKPEDLLAREQAHIDSIGSDKLHNECFIAGKSTGYSLSVETRAKISAAKKGNKNALGIKRSDETRARMSEAQKLRFAKERLENREVA